MESYLVVLCSHIDTLDKKNTVLETLRYFKENNIDVCFSTHSTDFLDEISEQVKFLIYDYNNEFLFYQDYIDNAKYIDDKYKYGHPNGTSHHNFGYTSISFPGSPHSKSALSLLRNGVLISHHNKYKWTIYLEYDIIQPKVGFKNYFETIIKDLEKNNKKCFYYNNIFDNFSFLWGGLFFFETESVFNYKKLTEGKWILTKKDWIKEWHLGFFESIVDFCFNEIFNKNEIFSGTIQDQSNRVWGVSKVSDISLYRYEADFYKKNQYLRKTFLIHMYPEIDKFGNKKLHLFYYNRGNQKVIMEEILVYSDTLLHLNLRKVEVLPHHWSTLPIDISGLKSDDIITLNWIGKTNNEEHSEREKLKLEDIEKVESNIIKIVFNS
jgi:hypothetical protein